MHSYAYMNTFRSVSWLRPIKNESLAGNVTLQGACTSQWFVPLSDR
jgi:hypothetical protein